MFHLNEGRALEQKKIDEVDYGSLVYFWGELEVGVKEDEDVDDGVWGEGYFLDALQEILGLLWCW